MSAKSRQREELHRMQLQKLLIWRRIAVLESLGDWNILVIFVSLNTLWTKLMNLQIVDFRTNSIINRRTYLRVSWEMESCAYYRYFSLDEQNLTIYFLFPFIYFQVITKALVPKKLLVKSNIEIVILDILYTSIDHKRTRAWRPFYLSRLYLTKKLTCNPIINIIVGAIWKYSWIT